jgi:hypothetical protein
MNNILIFEAFNSSKINSLLRYLNKKESNRIITDLRDIMKEHNYPISNLDDVSISYNKTRDALDLIPETGFYLKYWYDKDGKFISKTVTKPEKTKLLAIKPRVVSSSVFNKEDFSKPKDYQYLYSHKSNTKPSEYFDWFKEGDNIYILCCNLNDYSPDDTLPVPVEATIYIDPNKRMYAIQNIYDGSWPSGDTNLWKKYGNHPWYIADDSLGSDHVIIAVEKGKGSMLSNSNLDVNEYEPKSDKSSLDYEDIIHDSDFAITIKLSDIINKEVSLSDIRKEREARKSGATALMSDDEIRKIKRRK